MRQSLSSVAVLLAAAAVFCAGCARNLNMGPEANAAEASELRKKLASGETGGGATETAGGAQFAGWADVSGTFKVVGEAPSPGKIAADKDTEVCGKHPLFDESVTVGKGGGLQNVVIFMRTKKPPVHPEYEGSASAEVLLDNKDCRFEPHVVVKRTSQTLKIKNSDPVGHNTKADAVSNASFNVLIPAGSTTEEKLTSEEAQPIKVGCSIHPWMGGWVVVRGDPYAAATNSDGAFDLKNVPAGKEVEFQLWHEKKKDMLAGVKVTGSDGKPIKVDGKGRFKLTLEDGKPLALAFEVPTEVLK